MTNSLSPFRWKEYPRESIFAADSHFRGNKKGKTQSQTATEVVERVTADTGRNPGSIRRLSAKGDGLIEQSEYMRKRKAA